MLSPYLAPYALFGTECDVEQGRRQGKVETRSEALTISVPEAGRRLGLSRNSAYQAAKNGELPVIRIGHRLLVSIFALDEMLGARRSLSGEEALAARPRTDRAERR